MIHTHIIDAYFRNPTHPISITLIGCGGTGSKLLTRLATINHTLLQLEHPGIDLVCYDFDKVEPNNVGRQGFLPADVNQNKAFNLISKINTAYGFDWLAYQEKYTAKTLKENTSNIIITCVDTIDIRMTLSKHNFKNNNRNDYNTPFYWMDCGNGKDFGQVILGTLRTIKQPKLDNTVTHQTLKNVVDVYGNLKQYNDEATQGISTCSIIESLNKQDLFINDEIGLSAAKIIYKLLTKSMLDFNGVIVNQAVIKSQPFLLN